jgi:hypothetical protein
VLARQALARFLLGDGQLVLTWSCASPDSSGGGASHGRPTLLGRVNAFKSTQAKKEKNEGEKHNMAKAWMIIQ